MVTSSEKTFWKVRWDDSLEIIGLAVSYSKDVDVLKSLNAKCNIFSLVRVSRSFVFCVVVYRSLLVLPSFLLTNVLSFLVWFHDSDYPPLLSLSSSYELLNIKSIRGIRFVYYYQGNKSLVESWQLSELMSNMREISRKETK